MWLFGSLWDRWEIAFKITTPLLHIAFSATQTHGSLVFWRMYKRQKEYLHEETGSAEVKEEAVIGITLGDASVESTGHLDTISLAPEAKCPSYSER